jgi:hypothetical protein
VLSSAADVNSEYGGIGSGERCNQSAYCINLGNKKDPSWHLADKIRIIPDQIVTCKLDPHFTEKMVKPTEERPGQNEQTVMAFALTSLGINPLKPCLNVSRVS